MGSNVNRQAAVIWVFLLPFRGNKKIAYLILEGEVFGVKK